MAEQEKSTEKEVTQTTTQEASFLDQLVEATGGSERAETTSWLSKIVGDAEQGTFRIEKKTLAAIDDRIRELDEQLSHEVSKVLHQQEIPEAGRFVARTSAPCREFAVG